MKALLVSFLLGAASIASAATAVQPELVTPGKVLAQPDLKTPLTLPWGAGVGIWTPTNGVLTSAPDPAKKHIPVLTIKTGPDPMIVDCEFQFTDGKPPRVLVIGCNGKVGHVGRVTIAGKKIALAENSKVNGKVTNDILAQQPFDATPGWHHLRIEYAGDTLTASLDSLSLRGSHPFLTTPKTMWFFAANDGVQLRNLSVTTGTAAK